MKQGLCSGWNWGWGGHLPDSRPKVSSLGRIGFGCALAVLWMAAGAAAQINASSPASSVPAGISIPVQQPATAATAAEMPLTAPEVTYENGQLSIMASNSTLGDILKAVRAVMGADIDIPPKASRERMAANLGPGPAREVLSSLLSWTDYNYLIQASDSDPDGVQSILLTARTKSPGSNAARAGRELASTALSHAATQANARPEEDAEDDASTDSQGKTAAATDPAKGLATEQAGVASTTSAAAQPASNASASTPQAPADAQEAPAEIAQSSKSDSADDPSAKNSGRMTQLQNLYEQRRQMIEDTRKPSSQN